MLITTVTALLRLDLPALSVTTEVIWYVPFGVVRVFQARNQP